jgi:hypothetical protein
MEIIMEQGERKRMVFVCVYIDNEEHKSPCNLFLTKVGNKNFHLHAIG